MRKTLFLIPLLFLSAASLAEEAPDLASRQLKPQGLTVEKLTTLNHLHDVLISPQGDNLLYGLKKGMHSADNHLYLRNIASGTTQQITSNIKAESNVVWAADGKSIYFLSSRSGLDQIWQLPITGGEARQITDLDLPIDGFKVSADGQFFVLAISVKPDCVEPKNGFDCTIAALDKAQYQKHHTRVYDHLMIRHWDTWKTPFKEHIFIAQAVETNPLVNGMITTAKDLIPTWQGDIAGINEVAINPNGKTVVFSAKNSATKQAVKNHAWTTNFDLFSVNLKTTQITNITKANKAWDASPVFSHDGRFLVYKAMKTPRYESDKFSLRLYDNITGKIQNIAPQWDRSVSDVVFADDNRTLLVTAEDIGQKSIFAINSEFGDVRRLYNVGTNSHVSTAGDHIYFTRHTLGAPTDIFTMTMDGYGFKQLTHINKEKLANVKFADFKQFSFKGWHNEIVHGYWLKPVNYQSGKKYPMAFLVHGGPQGNFGNMFHYRWNAQLWAAQGYGVVMIDFHGSTGYGQKFTDSIARDWGGKPLVDLQKGFDYIVKSQPWLDGNNACALGASYGGYMMNWIESHWSDRFKCIVNHDGLFDMPSFYWATEELWFPEHDMGGFPWKDKHGKISDDYHKFNPSAFVDQWKTPMLVFQGERDFRVPAEQSFGAFTSLQRRGIDSRLIVFKDENHFVGNSNNLIFWYHQVFKWIDKYTGKSQKIDSIGDKNKVLNTEKNLAH